MEDSSVATAKSKSYFISPHNSWDDDDLQEENSDMDEGPAGSVAIISLNGFIVK